ncbi:MAG: hypothetical protein LC733_08290 [Actinobacteria bacterium]|nr:hypothetical protein [Actinomycetota bacterium]
MSRTHENPTIPLLNFSRRVLTVALLVGTMLTVLDFGAPSPAMGAAGQPARTGPPSTVPGATVPPPPPSAESRPEVTPPPVDVIEVSGRIDAIEADFIARSITAAEQSGSQLLVIQLDSPGSLISEVKVDELAFRISHAGLPVAVWVGPSGSSAYGGAVRLMRAAATSGVATGTRVGRFRGRCPLCPAGDPLLTRRSLSADDALRLGAVDTVAPTLGDFIVEQDGKQLGGRQVETARVILRDTPRREPIAQVRFAKLTVVQRVLHATTSPELAYLLLMIGLLLIVFEFFSAGIGVAGVTGAGSLILAAYGLGALGPSPLGLGLIGLAIFGYAVDVQAGAPRAWTVIGTVSLLVGSWVLFPGDRRVGGFVIAVVVVGTVIFMLRGMTTMVRGRFSTAAIDRKAFVGEAAETTEALDPEGVIRMRGALWRARARSGPDPMAIPVGAPVRVVALDGLVLEVEPQGALPEPPHSQAG